MKRISGIYKITNILNGDFYIGQSVDIYDRWQSHKKQKKLKFHLQYAFEKYGVENFKFEILIECSIAHLDFYELFLINEMKPHYNIKGGGASLHKMNEETKRKLSEINKGNIISEEVRLKISEKLKGKKFTDEHKQKISKALTGIKRSTMSNEHKNKISESNKGKKMSAENIEKLIERNKAHIWTDEMRKNASKGQNPRKILCVETGIEYDSIPECARQMGLEKSSIWRVAKGNFKKYKGYTFKYI